MPSKDLMEEMGADEKSRLASQAEELGEDGLSGKQEELDQAVEANEVSLLHCSFCGSAALGDIYTLIVYITCGLHKSGSHNDIVTVMLVALLHVCDML